MNLTEFLLARIAEDEAMAERRFDAWRNNGGVLDLTLTPGPARVIAECRAKRRLIERVGNPDWAGFRILAAVYADHPDYVEAWSERPKFTDAQRQELADMTERLRIERPNLPDGI